MRPEDLLRRYPPMLWKATEPLKTCKACEKAIARSARTCPHCGQSYTTAGGILIAIVIGLIIAAILI